MRELIEEVLNLQPKFAAANTPDMRRRGELVRREIPAALRTRLAGLSTSSGIGALAVQGKDGTGLKTETPWVRVYSSERSPSATTGWYAVYLFAADGDRVYLSLNQGTTRWDGIDFTPRAPSELVARVAWARKKLSEASPLPDGWTTSIALQARRSALGPAYERGNVYAKSYELGSLPPDDILIADLQEALEMLGIIYASEDTGLDVPGDSPEVADALAQADLSAGNLAPPKKKLFRLSAPERRAIELRAMEVATAHLVSEGWTVKDVGAVRSYDLDARRANERIAVEVKGTTASGTEVVLTANEVKLHLDRYPDNALMVVHSIDLVVTDGAAIADGGVLEVRHPWALSENDLAPIAYRYSTGF
jgi:hypothetical protein